MDQRKTTLSVLQIPNICRLTFAIPGVDDPKTVSGHISKIILNIPSIFIRSFIVFLIVCSFVVAKGARPLCMLSVLLVL